MQIEVIKKRVTSGEPRWYWRIPASNGKILAHSELYNTKRSALGAVDTLRKNMPDAALVIKE